ncbi:pseudaminic acid cytidylyltransferase [Brevundimonas lutea]|uniref:pseudaminic acid cytidylyltransferase n=1 Tax=Brevundimonas lutea TaxID=2293980 RepID=UPI000F040CA1|nr:pseudaminic acid cytidylyltransferase [Brevundimonas lutea]
MKLLAVIPARAGSKRVPGKNVRPFHGRPMLGWPVQAALDSNLFHTVMVSTEDEAVARIACAEGAEVPFLRSSATADDRAGLMSVLAEVLETWEARGEAFDAVCCLLATAALATPARLREGLSLYRMGDWDGVYPVLAYPHPIERATRRETDGRTTLIDPVEAETRTQDLEPAWHDAGQFYWLSPEVIRARRSVLTARCATLTLSEMEAQDIDTEDDWRLAEMKFVLMRDRSGSP